MADLRQITADILRRAGVADSDIDIGTLAGAISGLVVSERTAWRVVLEQLQAFFQFDVHEGDGRLRLQMRGKQSIALIDEADLLEDGDERLTITRLPESELPERLDVVYRDKNNDYLQTVQSAIRQPASQATRQTVALPASLSADRAKQQADVLLSAAWVERFRFQFRLPPRYLILTAGDCITLQTSSRAWSLRITGITYQDGVLKVEAVATDAASYQQQYAATPVVAGSAVKKAGLTTLQALDVPLVDESSDTAAYFVAVNKADTDTAWVFASVFEAFDDINYNPIFTTQQSATVGQAVTVLAPASTTVFWDTTSVVDVVLDSGSLVSVSKTEVLNGANAAVLGEEIIQFASATLIAVRTYRLSMLLRGRRGTEHAAITHQADDIFVLLDAGITRQPIAASSIAVPRQLKAVANGQLVEEQQAVAFTPQARCLQPFSPVHVRGSRDNNGSLIIQWKRRTRIAGGWQDYADVPLAEESQEYAVEIMNGTTLLRTLTSIAPQVVYSDAMQVMDFGGLQSAVSVRVMQVSALVGRGIPAIATL